MFDTSFVTLEIFFKVFIGNFLTSLCIFFLVGSEQILSWFINKEAFKGHIITRETKKNDKKSYVQVFKTSSFINRITNK